MLYDYVKVTLASNIPLHIFTVGILISICHLHRCIYSDFLHIYVVQNIIDFHCVDLENDLHFCYSKYQLFIVEGQAQPCLHNGLNETITPSKIPLTLEVEAGVKSIKGSSLEMGTIGHFSLCYYAVVQEKVCDAIGNLKNFA